MNENKSALIKEIKGMMSSRSHNKGGYNPLSVYKTVDKLFVRLGIVVIIGLLGYIAIRRCK